MYNRNVTTHFSRVENAVHISRAKFDCTFSHKTTFNAGELVPLPPIEILPGDTMVLDLAQVVRESTPIHPVMDDAFIDAFAFFVPNRLVWDHWKEFMGENTESAWYPETQYSVPQITPPEPESEGESGGWIKGSIADHFGIPTQVSGNLEMSSLPFRGYGLIWNEYFRDENLMDPLLIPTGDSDVEGLNPAGDYELTALYGGDLLPVCKFHDRFTSALPAPQKGPDVLLPFNSEAVPVVSDTNVTWKVTSALVTPTAALAYPAGIESDPRVSLGDGTNGPTWILDKDSGVYADLSDASFAPTINALRLSFATQRLLELDARAGSRYTEILLAHFGVTSPDARLQRPEYLGGFRQRINMQQVLQTSSSDDVSPQGNTAAYSLTASKNSLVSKSFTEHGYVFILVAVRTAHTYQYGLARHWSRKDRLDYYWPAFAHLGEQPILNKEIYAQGTDADDEVFGYQECFSEYRYIESGVSGAFRSNYAMSLDVWHYADEYDSLPILSGGAWISETKNNVDRTLAVTSEVEDQFIADFVCRCDMIRPMPVYGTPGLIDHM